MSNNDGNKIINIKMFGAYLCAARKNASYSQRELAEQLKVSAATISYWESGKIFPNKKRQKMIEKILQVELFDKIYIKNDYENIAFVKEMLALSKKMSKNDRKLVIMFARDIFYFRSPCNEAVSVKQDDDVFET